MKLIYIKSNAEIPKAKLMDLYFNKQSLVCLTGISQIVDQNLIHFKSLFNLN